MLKEVSIEEFIARKSSYDLIIDARSPGEYNQSKIQSSTNFYALDDIQHAQIGTLYKNNSAKAKVMGASFICANMSEHLQTIYKDFPLGSHIGIYCARGGMRSSSLAIILSSTGYIVQRLIGGYKSYRKFVLNYLDNFEHEKFIALCGNTGCGKSELLSLLPNSISIEELTNHFGSTFGSIKGVQPSQKEFQNRLCSKLLAIDPKEWIFIEAESKRLGSLVQPERFSQKTHDNTFNVLISAPLELRIERILRDYKNIDEKYFMACMNYIHPYIKKSASQGAIEAFLRSDLEEVARILLEEYYDKVYKKPQKINFSLHVKDISEAKRTLEALRVELKNGK